jgi:phosphoglycerol transferase MdoB-like AlkP superfamily enzyme
LALRSDLAARTARALVSLPPDLDRDVARHGLGGSIVVDWLAWRRQERPPAAALAVGTPPVVARPSGGAPFVVAIQCESFVDVASRGAPGPELPAYHALAREAAAWGRCRVPAEGAYTMRSEFCFLTGLPAATLGLDALDPYLTAEAYAPFSIAGRMAQAGWRTTFLHPYDRRFFDRDLLAPKLGFQRFVDEAAFEGAARFGPYVADSAVADFIVAEIETARTANFLFAVTIENHGPWGPGRLEGVDDPAEQYARHLANADAMIGRIASALAARPDGGLLCVYGDHAPARTLLPELPDRLSTDYLLWSARARRPVPAPREDLAVDALSARLLALS